MKQILRKIYKNEKKQSTTNHLNPKIFKTKKRRWQKLKISGGFKNKIKSVIRNYVMYDVGKKSREKQCQKNSGRPKNQTGA